MSYLRRPIILAVMTATLLGVGNIPGRTRAADEVSPLKQALGAAFFAKAELALLKGQLNTGKVYIAAAHEADPGISPFQLKTLDMMYKDFPYRPQGLPGYFSYRAIACSMDDRFLVYTSTRGISRLDLETNEVKSIVRDDLRISLNIVLSPNGRFAAGCYNEGKLTLCDMELGKVVGEYSFRRERPRSLTTVKMSFSPDEKLLAASYEHSDDDKRGIHFLSTKDLSIVKTMPGHGRILKFLGDGSLLLGMNGRCLLVDTATLQPIKTLASTTGWDADYLPRENLLAVGGGGRITVFNTATQEKLAEYQAASHNIVMVRFLAAGRYIVYASPKGESGVIDCVSGKPLQVFEIGREAAVSPDRYLLFADGKVIDLSACRPYEADLSAEMPHTTRLSRPTIPEGVMKALTDTSEKALSRSGRSIRLAVKNASGDLEAYGTSDGRTFIYDRTRKEVNLLLTDHYPRAIDFAFFPDNSHFVRLCKYGNGQAGAVEVYSLRDGHRRTLHLDDPPVSVAIAPDLGVAAILDRKNRVYLVNLPSLDVKVELLPAVLSKRQLFVDQKTKTLVVKTNNDTVAYDLRKVADDRTLSTYAEASSRYSVSLDESELQF